MPMDAAAQTAGNTKIRLGVSACLSGANVRFDGGHKQDRFISDLLAGFFEFVAFCPEVAIGLGTPREPIQLVEINNSIRAVNVRHQGVDVSHQLQAYADRTSALIETLCGFIVKKDSPSCGMERVKVYKTGGLPLKNASGLFTEKMMRNHPLLPVEEEGRLHDAVLRENFMNRVLVYARWKALSSLSINMAGLIDFHTCHKYLLLAHNQARYRLLGRRLSCVRRDDLDEFVDNYIHEVMSILKQRASRKAHVNVLQHLLGFLRASLDSDERMAMRNAIDAYASGEFPLIVPITLLQHHFRRNPHRFVSRQVYLYPYPCVMLKNAI